MSLLAEELVGRSTSLARARESLQAALAGRGGVTVVCGEAGIGKSAFTAALAQEAQAMGFRVLTGRAWELGDAPAYFPVRAGLRALGVTPSVPVASDADAFGLWEDLLETLAQESARAPIFWWLEDLHAADARTLELMLFLVQPLRALPVILVATVRTGDPRASGAVLTRLTRLLRDGGVIDLPRLSERELVALAERVAGRTLPAHSLEAWMAKTSGNPLFVVECARAVRAGRAVESALPETVVQLVTERLRQLSAATRGFLEQGAVLGRDFSAAQLARLAERLPAEVIDALLPALRGGLLDETAPGKFRFAHALVRDAIEDAMPAHARCACHARAAVVLGERGDAADVLAERARHAIEGLGAIAQHDAQALVDRAVAVLELDGARDRAFALWRRWLDAAQIKPDSATLLQTARLATAASNHAQARKAAEDAFALAKLGNDAVGMAHAALAHGAELRAGIVDPVLVRELDEALVALATSHPPLACRVRARLAAAMIPASDARVPVALAHEAIAAARAGGDVALLREVLFLAGSALIDIADAAENHALAGELLALSLAAGDTPRTVRAHARLAFGNLTLGDFAAFDADVDRLLALSAASGHPALAWQPALLASLRALARGRFDESERFVVEVEQMASMIDDPALHQSLLAHRAHRALALDDEAQIRATYAPVAKLIERIPGADVFRAPIAALFALRLADRAAVLAEIPALLRLPATSSLDALAAAGEAVAFAGTQEQRAQLLKLLLPFDGREVSTGHVPYTYEGPIARVLGLLEASLGLHDAAERRLEAARTRCRAFGLQPWVARLSLERGRVLVAAGRDREARALFAEAIALAGELGMTGVAQRARQVLGVGGSAVPPTAAAPAEAAHAGLELAREGEVWRIAWAGRTVRVRDSRGVQLLAKLVAANGERIHALALAGDSDGFIPESDAGEALDRKAVAAYRARLSQLDDTLAELEAKGDARRSAQARREREMLVAEITRAVGLGGRLRKIGSATERARINVTRRLKDAIARIAEGDAELGRHLEAQVRTGTYCSYREKR